MERFEVGRHAIVGGWLYMVAAKDGEAVELEDVLDGSRYRVPLRVDADGEYLLATDGERVRP